ncbi:hypothetical protein D3C78_157780 [compost metagenome]
MNVIWSLDVRWDMDTGYPNAGDWEYEEFKGEFSALVLNHMTNILSSQEWESLRSLSCGIPVVDEPVQPGATRAEVLADSLCEVYVDPAEILTARYKDLAVKIGAIDGGPVFYVETQGYYFWGRNGGCLDVMITWPAYPPKWFEDQLEVYTPSTSLSYQDEITPDIESTVPSEYQGHCKLFLNDRSSAVFPSFDEAESAAYAAVSPTVGGYSNVRIEASTDAITHASAIDWLMD